MKLSIRYLSDLHLEFRSSREIKQLIKNISSGHKTANEICVVAGDIGSPYEPHYDIVMNFLSQHFQKTFVIAGNHEYYHKTKRMQETNAFLDRYFQQFPTISFLNNQSEYYQGHHFIGTTLWSRITDPSHKINDMYSIPDFDPIQYNQLNTSSIDFLHHTFEHHEPCIVITHHVPSFSLIDAKYKTEHILPYNQWFYCDMDHTIETYRDKIKCWIYGHTHAPSYRFIHNIPFLCNPIGYPRENGDINFQATITI